MVFPLSLYDLSLWLAAVSIILLATSELLAYYPGYDEKFFINKQVLRWIAIGCGLAFAVTVVMHVAQVF
ncbi:MAG: hypothetical protein ACFCUE_01550 [Candidatus Bathyarchaeia archaeon]|jgi:hypothetical protein